MYILRIFQNHSKINTYLNCMCNPNPITQHGFKMFRILLFSCELKLKLKDQSSTPPMHDIPLYNFFKGKEGKH